MDQILEAVRYIIYLVLGGLAIYFKYSEVAQTKAKKICEVISELTASAAIFIKEAEEEYKSVTNAGGEKFQLVVNKLHDMIPEPFDKFITIEMIKSIVQSTFDQMEAYAATQVDNAVSKLSTKKTNKKSRSTKKSENAEEDN